MSKDFLDRLLDFSVSIIEICKLIPKSYTGIHIRNQLIRSGTSIGANFSEARGAESDPDFVHKMNISLKEAHESLYWLKLLERAKLVNSNNLSAIIKENDEICSILIASVKTLKNKKLQRN